MRPVGNVVRMLAFSSRVENSKQIISIKVWETVVVVPPYIADFISLVLLYIKQPHYFIAGV